MRRGSFCPYTHLSRRSYSEKISASACGNGPGKRNDPGKQGAEKPAEKDGWGRSAVSCIRRLVRNKDGFGCPRQSSLTKNLPEPAGFWFRIINGSVPEGSDRFDHEVILLPAAQDEEFPFDKIGDADIHCRIGDTAVVDVDAAFLDPAAGFTF